jgi:hypothetical protein
MDWVSDVDGVGSLPVPGMLGLLSGIRDSSRGSSQAPARRSDADITATINFDFISLLAKPSKISYL